MTGIETISVIFVFLFMCLAAIAMHQWTQMSNRFWDLNKCAKEQERLFGELSRLHLDTVRVVRQQCDVLESIGNAMPCTCQDEPHRCHAADVSGVHSELCHIIGYEERVVDDDGAEWIFPGRVAG